MEINIIIKRGNNEDSAIVNDPAMLPTASTSTPKALNYLPWKDLEQYFTCSTEIKTDTENLSVLCVMCNKTLSVPMSSPLHLLEHLQASHKEEHAKYLKTKADLKSASEEGPPNKRLKTSEPKQLTMCDFLVDRKLVFVSQKRVDDVIVDLIVNEGLPLKLVDSPYFKKCALLGLPRYLTAMTWKKLVCRLEDDYIKSKKSLIEILTEVQYVTTTADCWSKFRRSYLGMTVHWMDPESLQKRSAALALRRIYSSHTYDVLAEEIHNVHKDYFIQNKVRKIITDSGSNFVKAFRLFSELESIAGTLEVESTPADGDENITWIHDILNSPDEDAKITLPPQQRCPAHTALLVVVLDAKRAFSNVIFKQQFDSAFQKLQTLWTKQKQSIVVANAIKKICSVYLRMPRDIRWHSLYEAVISALDLLKVPSQNEDAPLTKVCDACGVDRFSSQEIKFLTEYTHTIEFVAQALRMLQDDEPHYYGLGYLLPTLILVRKELTRVRDSGLVYCLPLAVEILEGLNRRFKKEFADEDCIIAACCEPELHFSWLLDVEEEEAAKELVLNELEEEAEKTEPVTGDPYELARNELREYQSFEFECIQHYPCGKKGCLQRYPLMKRVFLKFNTPIPSSGTVERLFSTTDHVLTNRRGRIDDYELEMQVLLKANKDVKRN